MNKQVRNLKSRPQVIVATPGRLIDHLDQGTVRLDRMDICVLDEADRMLDMGFAPAIKRILDVTPRERQTMLFSATMPAGIRELADKYLYKPQTLEVARSGSTAEGVRQELEVVAHEAKRDLLADHLSRSSGPVLVFARTRHGARKLAKVVRAFGHEAAELHSDRTLNQRRAAMHRFKTGEVRVLVATDIAARGIDVKEIELVINFDLPQCAEDYIHRIGRTGRAGAEGMAVTFATPEQRRDVRDIEKLLGNAIPRSSGSMELDTSEQPIRPKRRGGKRRPAAEKPEAKRHDEAAKPAFKPNRKKRRPRSFAPAGAGRNGR
jgi:ATP-dependent RNA helicase RhlE